MCFKLLPYSPYRCHCSALSYFIPWSQDPCAWLDHVYTRKNSQLTGSLCFAVNCDHILLLHLMSLFPPIFFFIRSCKLFFFFVLQRLFKLGNMLVPANILHQLASPILTDGSAFGIWKVRMLAHLSCPPLDL